MYQRTSTGASSRGSSGVRPLRVRNSTENSVSQPRARLSSTGNGRSSMGGRPSLTPSYNKRALSRPSTSAVPPTKRHSSMRPGFGHELMKDPRPINDRAFKERSIKMLVEFLTENGYPYPISPKLLHAPCIKDFVRIFEFLMSFVDPKFKCGSKVEEEIPKHLKQLGYPFNISKSSLFAVGSPHTWPTLLAALTWFRVQIQYAMNIDAEQLLFAPDGENDFETLPESKIVYMFCEQTYSLFMTGSDTYDELEDELRKQLRKNAPGGGNMDNLTHENRRLSQELQSLEEQPDQLVHLKDIMSSLTVDLEKMNRYEKSLDDVHRQQEQTMATLEDDNEGLKVELPALEADNRRKQQILETQEFSPADLQRINHERQELIHQKEAHDSENEGLQQHIWQEQMQIGKFQQNIDKKCAEYNKMAQMLQLIPASAENAFGVDYELRPCLMESESAKFLSTIKPALTQVKNQCCNKVHEAEEEAIIERDAKEQLNEMIVTREEEELSMLESKLQRLETDLDSLKTNQQRQTQRMQRDIETKHETLVQMRQPEDSDIHQMGIRLAEEKERGRVETAARENEQRTFTDFLINAATMMIEHKAVIQGHCQNVLEDIEKRYLKEKTDPRYTRYD